MIIDAHQHFWTLSRGDYPWPNETVAPIFRDYGPDDLLPLLRHAGVDRTILVQAAPSLAETEFLLGVAARCDQVAGVVGWVDLASPAAEAEMERLAANPVLKGLRPMLQDIDETGWILREDVKPALLKMEALGLRFDALVQPRHLPDLAELARRHPGLQIVVDHAAKPAISKGRPVDQAWHDGMSKLAARPNVYCKLSGLVTEAGPGWAKEDLAPVARHVLSRFGAERVMFGSDWPVLNLASDYFAWTEMLAAITSHLGGQEKEALWGGTACSFYGL